MFLTAPPHLRLSLQLLFQLINGVWGLLDPQGGPGCCLGLSLNSFRSPVGTALGTLDAILWAV